ncbi:MAG: M3 family metallopeptidase [Deinococcales bacterium]
MDASNDRARAELTALDPAEAKLGALIARITAWVGALDVDALGEASSLLRDHGHALRRIQAEALHLMGEEAEALAAALEASGAGAWERLHSDLVSRRTITVQLPGDDEARPYALAELGVRLSDEREEVRSAAFTALTELLEQDAVPFAAALNGVKGQTLELARRRGWPSVLDATLFENAIDAQSLEAMRTATAEAAPVMQRYLKAKARYLGKEALRWPDLQAPVAMGEQRRFDWEEAKAFVVERFGRYSERLAAFADRAFREGWVDAPPRPGKRNGAFCSRVPGRKESRVMLNFGGRLSDVFTLAHELGHAYHNDCLYRFERTALQAQLPMALAETASIFCETLVANGLLDEADEAMELAILEQDLRHSTTLVLDIESRFRFESAVFEGRAQRALAPAEFSEMMERYQREVYGDAVAEDGRHRLAWADKPHYYFSSRSFYNYPYTFGFLFGRGLYSAYREDPASFLDRYDALLSSTGMANAATLASDFGIDIHDPDFWRDGLAVARERVERYEALVGRMTP